MSALVAAVGTVKRMRTEERVNEPAGKPRDAWHVDCAGFHDFDRGHS